MRRASTSVLVTVAVLTCDEPSVILCNLRARPGVDRVPFILTRDRSMPLPPLDMPNLAGLLTRPYDFAAARLVVHSALHLGFAAA